ncbi:MAG: hypothetical protein FJ095_00670 [Deltaproteobacteria bacterium]|nr:hypothetical protein [Deltaproteobacteria bacterium]
MSSNAVLALPWRQRLHPVYALSIMVFVAVLLTIASREGQFQPVHRATMLGGALLFAYSLVAQIVNVTRLSVEDGVLRVAHGPLPWRGTTALPLDEVRMLRCEPHSRRLVLKTRIGEEFVLGENLPEAQLEAIDRDVRERLGIATSP